MAASESRRSIIGRRYDGRDLSRQISNSRDDNEPKSTKDEPKVVFWNISTSLSAICRVGFDVLIRMNAVASHFTQPKNQNVSLNRHSRHN